MKKILVLMLALVLCLSLLACGGPEEEAGKGNNQEGFVDMADEEALAKLWVGSFVSEDGEHTLDIRENGSCTLDGEKYTWICRVVTGEQIVLDIYDGDTALWGAGPYDPQQILSLSLYEGPGQDALPDLSGNGIITLANIGKCEKIVLKAEDFYDYFYFTEIPYYRSDTSDSSAITQYCTYLMLSGEYQDRLVASDVHLEASCLEQSVQIKATSDLTADPGVRAEGEVLTREIYWNGPWDTETGNGMLLSATVGSADIDGMMWIQRFSNLEVHELEGYLWLAKD